VPATGFKVPRKGVLLSLGPLTDKYWFADQARVLSQEMGLKLYAAHGTAEALTTMGIACTELAKRPQDGAMTGMDAIEQGLVDLVINIPIEYDELCPPRWIPHPPPGGGRGHPAHHRPEAGAGNNRGFAPPKGEGPGHPLMGRVRRAAPGGIEVK
jgi:MGS-like domain